jgi:hypothetical protein
MTHHLSHLTCSNMLKINVFDQSKLMSIEDDRSQDFIGQKHSIDEVLCLTQLR